MFVCGPQNRNGRDETSQSPYYDKHLLMEAVQNMIRSPIDITIKDSTWLQLPPLQWHNHHLVPKKMKITNTGYTVTLSARWNDEMPYISHGPMETNYVFSQVHFHWGARDLYGSEHSVDHTRYPLEMHAVYYSDNFHSQEAALQHPDGLLVVVYFFVIQDDSNRALDDLVNSFHLIKDLDSASRIRGFNMSGLLPAFADDYLLYRGSVLSQSCYHQMTWTISRAPLGVSSQQLRRFRLLKRRGKEPPVVELERRALCHVNPAEDRAYTLHPLHHGKRYYSSTKRIDVGDDAWTRYREWAAKQPRPRRQDLSTSTRSASTVTSRASSLPRESRKTRSDLHRAHASETPVSCKGQSPAISSSDIRIYSKPVDFTLAVEAAQRYLDTQKSAATPVRVFPAASLCCPDPQTEVYQKLQHILSAKPQRSDDTLSQDSEYLRLLLGMNSPPRKPGEVPEPRHRRRQRRDHDDERRHHDEHRTLVTTAMMTEATEARHHPWWVRLTTKTSKVLHTTDGPKPHTDAPMGLLHMGGPKHFGRHTGKEHRPPIVIYRPKVPPPLYADFNKNTADGRPAALENPRVQNVYQATTPVPISSTMSARQRRNASRINMLLNVDQYDGNVVKKRRVSRLDLLIDPETEKQRVKQRDHQVGPETDKQRVKQHRPLSKRERSPERENLNILTDKTRPTENKRRSNSRSRKLTCCNGDDEEDGARSTKTYTTEPIEPPQPVKTKVDKESVVTMKRSVDTQTSREQSSVTTRDQASMTSEDDVRPIPPVEKRVSFFDKPQAATLPAQPRQQERRQDVVERVSVSTSVSTMTESVSGDTASSSSVYSIQRMKKARDALTQTSLRELAAAMPSQYNSAAQWRQQEPVYEQTAQPLQPSSSTYCPAERDLSAPSVTARPPDVQQMLRHDNQVTHETRRPVTPHQRTAGTDMNLDVPSSDSSSTPLTCAGVSHHYVGSLAHYVQEVDVPSSDRRNHGWSYEVPPPQAVQRPRRCSQFEYSEIIAQPPPRESHHPRGPQNTVQHFQYKPPSQLFEYLPGQNILLQGKYTRTETLPVKESQTRRRKVSLDLYLKPPDGSHYKVEPMPTQFDPMRMLSSRFKIEDQQIPGRSNKYQMEQQVLTKGGPPSGYKLKQAPALYHVKEVPPVGRHYKVESQEYLTPPVRSDFKMGRYLEKRDRMVPPVGSHYEVSDRAWREQEYITPPIRSDYKVGRQQEKRDRMESPVRSHYKAERTVLVSKEPSVGSHFKVGWNLNELERKRSERMEQQARSNYNGERTEPHIGSHYREGRNPEDREVLERKGPPVGSRYKDERHRTESTQVDDGGRNVRSRQETSRGSTPEERQKRTESPARHAPRSSTPPSLRRRSSSIEVIVSESMTFKAAQLDVGGTKRVSEASTQAPSLWCLGSNPRKKFNGERMSDEVIEPELWVEELYKKQVPRPMFVYTLPVGSTPGHSHPGATPYNSPLDPEQRGSRSRERTTAYNSPLEPEKRVSRSSRSRERTTPFNSPLEPEQRDSRSSRSRERTTPFNGPLEPEQRGSRSRERYDNRYIDQLLNGVKEGLIGHGQSRDPKYRDPYNYDSHHSLTVGRNKSPPRRPDVTKGYD